jgi:hypothetical protein
VGTDKPELLSYSRVSLRDKDVGSDKPELLGYYRVSLRDKDVGSDNSEKPISFSKPRRPTATYAEFNRGIRNEIVRCVCILDVAVANCLGCERLAGHVIRPVEFPIGTAEEGADED